MNYSLEQLQRKKNPIYSLKAPLSLAKRESGLETHQIYRNEFMRDRDRVLYSKAFRRLAGKTQVYLSGVDDHRRTRLTHTLEVSQIARSIAASLRLDTDLVEAIALGHDLGHTPFGHVGERTLHEIMTPQVQHILGDTCPVNLHEKDEKISEELVLNLGFKHNIQSLKTAMKLEKNYGNNGLDLTNFTLYGIQAHSSTHYKEGRISNYNKLAYYDLFKKSGCMLNNGQFAWSLESFVVAEADEIAQRHHDVEDAIRGNLVSREEIISIIQLHFNKHLSPNDRRMLKQSKELDEETFIATISRIIVNMYVTKLIRASVFNINTFIFEENINQNSFVEYLQTHSPSDANIKRLISYNTAIMVLGIAGGNGLEHINKEKIKKIYGVDVNPNFLEECKKRYNELEDVFDTICVDLLSDNLQLPSAELLVANLLIEYIGYECFQRVVKLVKPQYISCIIQINLGDSFVSNSPYINAFDCLDKVHNQMEENNLVSFMHDIDYKKKEITEKLLPNGKKFVRIDFCHITSDL